MIKYNANNKKLFDKKILRSIIIGMLCGIAVITIATILLSFVLVISGAYPSKIIDFITLSFLALGGLTGGYISVRLNKASGLAVGAATGIIIFLIILIVGLIQSTGSVTIYTLFKLLILTLFSALGGVLGVNKQKKIKF